MLYYAAGSATTELSEDQLRAALAGVFDELGPRDRVIVVPPDLTRFNSRAGQLTCTTYDYYGEHLVDYSPRWARTLRCPTGSRK